MLTPGREFRNKVITSMKGLGEEMYRAWFAIAGFSESEEELVIESMLKEMKRVAPIYYNLSHNKKMEEARKYSEHIGFTPKMIGFAMSKFFKAMNRKEDIFMIFQSIFGREVDDDAETFKGSGIYLIENGCLPIPLSNPESDTVKVVIRQQDGEEIIIEMHRGETLTFL